MDIDKNKTYIVGEFQYINYINLTLEQKLEILKARNRPIVREKMYSSEPISESGHLSFIESLKSREDRYYWFVTKQGCLIGSFNITDINNEENSCESGIFFNDVSLRGIEQNIKFAYNTMKFLFTQIGMNKVTGFVKEDNVFNLQINKFLGFAFKESKNGYQEIYMTKSIFDTIDENSISLRSYLKSIKS